MCHLSLNAIRSCIVQHAFWFWLRMCRGYDGSYLELASVSSLNAGLPKTRSGKIMRRVLRKIAAKEEEQLGDTSTLADPSVVDTLLNLRDQ